MCDHESEEDDDLIARIAGGDRDAFALLYRRYRPDIYRFAAHVSGSTAVADDVVQDVFVAVIEHAREYRLGCSVLAWLLGIARNHVRRWRSQRPVVPLPGDETPGAQDIAVQMDPLADISVQRHRSAVRRALLQLPIRYREIIILCDLQELTYAEAADALGCAVGTVRSRLHRGRTLLAKRLSHSQDALLCRMPAARSMV